MEEKIKFTMEEGRQCPEKVIVLDLSEAGITEIDLEILGFDNLEELILDRNPELKTLPEELEYLPNIHKVSLIGCNSVLLTQLSVFTNLESLDISEMYFSDSEALQALGKMKSLKELKMNDCTHPYMKDKYNLHFRLPGELGKLEQLERLSINNCFLEKLPDSLCFLQKLSSLSIKNNFIETIPQGLLELPSLCEFYGEGNKLKKEQKRIMKIRKERPDFITDQINELNNGKLEDNSNSTRTAPLLSPKVLSELARLGFRLEEIDTEERYFTPLDTEEEAAIPPSMVQLLWGVHWNEMKLLWKEPPFSCEETWNDEDFCDGDEEYLQREKELTISYSFYAEESFCINETVYLVIGYFKSSGQPYYICVSLKDENMGDPDVYTYDSVSEEPFHMDSLSGFLVGLTTEDKWEDEYTAMNLRLFYEDEKSNKIWEIKVVGNRQEIRFGKNGSEGQKKIKEFDSPEAAFKEAKRLATEKKNKGYQE